MQTLNVELGERRYPIHIGAGLLRNVELIAARLPRKRVAIVTNETVAPLYLAPLRQSLRGAGVESVAVVIPDGEPHKTWETLNRVFDALIAHHCDRWTTVIALGGGVVGDLAGFAAAIYQRGVPYVQVPTTLLAQVDSSVGGKTAINHPLAKNMIGAFYQPLAVVADTDTLTTLPERELSAGLAEIIKYGLIRDPVFFAWLEGNVERLVRRETAVAQQPRHLLQGAHYAPMVDGLAAQEGAAGGIQQRADRDDRGSLVQLTHPRGLSRPGAKGLWPDRAGRPIPLARARPRASQIEVNRK